MKERIFRFFAALAGAVVSFFSGIPPIMWVLVAVMSLDFVTGLICGAMGKSLKTESGKLSSGAAFAGLMKKVLILCVVALATLIDYAVAQGAGVEFAAVAGATALWFIASEGVSILENAAALGVPIPGVLMRALEVMQSKDEVGERKEDKSVS